LRQTEKAAGFLEHIGKGGEPEAFTDDIEKIAVSALGRIGVMLNST